MPGASSQSPLIDKPLPVSRPFSSSSSPLPRYRVARPPLFTSCLFPVTEIALADRTERIVKGSRDLFAKLPQAFADIQQIGVIGWGSQGPAQAQNLRDSLNGTNINVKVGLRENSPSIPLAEKEGFTKVTNTLGEMFQVIRESDFVLLLISDAVCAERYKDIFKNMKEGAYLGLSHGFLLGYLNSVGDSFPKHLNVIAACPKGMGPSVRRLYQQGAEIGGSGINCSFAVHQSSPANQTTNKATEVALGWAVGLGSPATFQTSLEAECKSDIFGERGILLGAVHGICEMLYRHYVGELKLTPEAAYIKTVEVITGPISKTISYEGLLGVYEKIQDKALFEKAYSLAYHPAMEVLLEIYEDVASGRELLSVVDHVKRFANYPLQNIDTTDMWTVGSRVRADRKKYEIEDKEKIPIDPMTAGVYTATMVAQCDLLIAAGHEYSEVVNESIIESVDSLNPYMHFKGVSYMVDNCSTTARLGARKWASRFDYLLQQQFLSDFKKNQSTRKDVSGLMEQFKTHKVHEIMKVCSQLRPSVDIVPEETYIGESRTTV